MPTPTRDRLIEAALRTLAEEGIAGTSARAIARTADVNQALVFYHFGTVEALLAEASIVVSTRRAQEYARRLADVATFGELSAAARALHAEERANGNLAVLTQLLAGARTHPALVPAVQGNFTRLAAEVERVVEAAPLARSVAAAFLGIELLDALSAEGDPGLFAALDTLTGLADAVAGITTVERALVRRRLRTLQERRPPAP
jgi:AcrR family transcriptional regulator